MLWIPTNHRHEREAKDNGKEDDLAHGEPEFALSIVVDSEYVYSPTTLKFSYKQREGVRRNP